MAVKDDSTLITKGDLKKFYNKILPYMGGNYVFNTLGTKDYYSEDEKVIGVWTDGRPVYRKVYKYVSTMKINKDTWTNSNIKLDNVDIIISSKVFGGSYGVYSDIQSSINGTVGIPSGTLAIYSTTVLHFDYLIIEYTKSTDAANSAVDTIGCYDITRPDLWPVEKEITFGNGLYGYRYQQASGGPNITISIKGGYNPNTFKFINQGGTLIRASDNAPHCNPSYGGPFWWVQGNGTLSIYTYGGTNANNEAWKNLDMWCLYTK